MSQKILSVTPRSPAARAGLRAGDEILRIGGEPVIDFLDYQALTAEKKLEILFRRNGEQKSVSIRKGEYDPLGLNFEKPMMSGMRLCCNRCLFCFVDQLPENVRPTMRVKDDDWRMSLMMGNYVTLTNVSDRELERMIARHASPLYISVHCTDPELRSHMVNREGEVTIGLRCETDQEGLQSMIGRLVDKALEHTGNPVEGDYITFQYASYKGMGRTGFYGGTPVVEIKYELSYYDDAVMEAETDKKVSEILESLQLEGKSKYDQIKAIYDYLCENIEYEPAAADNDIRRTAYGALVEGKAVCQGYSVSLYRLLLASGIDNRIIFGKGVSPDGTVGPHTWNIVNLYGKYYYVDTTWGDSSIIDRFFLRPANTEFEDSHIADEEFTTEAFKELYPMADEAFDPELCSIMEMSAGMTKKLADSILNVLANNNGY